MRKEVIDFYSHKTIPISSLITKRSRGMKSWDIEAAAEMVFDEIQDGLEIKDQDIPRYVWKKAHNVASEKYKKDRVYIVQGKMLAKKFKSTKEELGYTRKRLGFMEDLSATLIWVIFICALLKIIGIIQ